MDWTWDEHKNRENTQKHRVSFDTAILVLDDPLSVTDDDPYPWESRYRTIGAANGVILVVVHTLPKQAPEFERSVGRIISARRATSRERRNYENH